MKCESCSSCPSVPAVGTVTSENRLRLKSLLEDGTFLHPMAPHDNFTDLAHAIALCCHSTPQKCADNRLPRAERLAAAMGGREQQHIILVLCDGLGNAVLDQHLPADSFLRTRNDPTRLVAVFPSTTPAALTTLATGVWPGQHGMPGWDLRDQKGCEFPGKPTNGPVQLRVLSDVVTDMRSKRPAGEVGFGDDRGVFVAQPWTSREDMPRHFMYVNAYNGTHFTDWYQGKHSGILATISETASATLGKPDGSAAAVDNFRTGVNQLLTRLAKAEEKGWQTYTYLYTAHPDKHMHALGVEHQEVARVVQGLDSELHRLWTEVQGLQATLVVTADHGHVSVPPDQMLTLPTELLSCLEYANIGVHGKGRHAIFHLRSGLRGVFEREWSKSAELSGNFLLLTVEDAVAEGLFGPAAPVQEVRPRLGDLIAISIGAMTIVTPDEACCWRDTAETKQVQGAHGSLTEDEMRIPFICCRSASSGESSAARI